MRCFHLIASLGFMNQFIFYIIEINFPVQGDVIGQRERQFNFAIPAARCW